MRSVFDTVVLGDYQEKMTAAAQDGCMVFIMRAREKAQELLALANKNSEVQASTTTP